MKAPSIQPGLQLQGLDIIARPSSASANLRDRPAERQMGAARVAGGDRGADAGGRSRRTDDVRADWRHASVIEQGCVCHVRFDSPRMKCVGPLNLVASRLALKIYKCRAGRKRRWRQALGSLQSIQSKAASPDDEDDGNSRRQIADAMLAEKSILMAIA
jgi:hypothetical protein